MSHKCFPACSAKIISALLGRTNLTKMAPYHDALFKAVSPKPVFGWGFPSKIIVPTGLVTSNLILEVEVTENAILYMLS